MYLAETISRVPKKGVTPLGIHIAGQRKVGFFLIMISFYARHVLNSAYTTTRGHGAEATAVSRNLCTRRVQMIRTVSGAKQGTDACRLIILMNHVIMSKKKKRRTRKYTPTNMFG